MTDTISDTEPQAPSMVRRLARVLALTDDGEKNYAEQVRALLAELREPTEAMVEACGGHSTMIDIAAIYRQMIDEARR